MLALPLESQILSAFKKARGDGQWDVAEHLFCALEALAKSSSKQAHDDRERVMYSAALLSPSSRNHP